MSRNENPENNLSLTQSNNQNNIRNYSFDSRFLNNTQNNDSNPRETNRRREFGENGANQNSIPPNGNNSKISNENNLQSHISNNNNFINVNENNENIIIIDSNNDNSNNTSNNSDSNNSNENIKASETLYTKGKEIQNDIRNNLNNDNNLINNYSINLDIPNPFFNPNNSNLNNNISYNQYQNNINQNIINRDNNNNIILQINQNNQLPFPLPSPMVNIKECIYFSKYKKPSLTGLKNLGNTSYFNAVLQLICNVKIFANFFLAEKNWALTYKSNPLAYTFHRLCTHIYPKENKKEIYKGNKVMKELKNYSLVYKDCSEKNPNELICFLLSKLNDELSLNGNYKENLIYNYFTWIKSKETKIQNISIDIKYQYFQTFDLNISEVAKFEKLNIIKINNCINFYNNKIIKIKPFNNQENQEKIIYKNEIYFYPKVFVFLVDLKDCSIKLSIEKKIYLGNLISPIIYQLNGIVFFDMNKKRYNALSVSPVDKMWYLYDDENVKPFNFENFISEYNENNIYRPNILLYIR